jgi:predicted ABC-type ATPase
VPNKVLYALVGGNGSGKSTFYQQFLAGKDIPFYNADEFAKKNFLDNPEVHSYEAAKIVAKQRLAAVHAGLSFCFETVFSHISKVDFLALAKGFGYTVNLIYIHLDDPTTNIARVISRVNTGGHNVPTDKIINRIPRTMENVKRAIPFCDNVLFYDNNSIERPFTLIAKLDINKNLLTQKSISIPTWLECIFENHIKQ